MPETPNNKDQSMEEILQSIKRIIADEESAPAENPIPVENESVVQGSDVLELKDMVEPSPADHLASILAEPVKAAPAPGDILGSIDAHFSAAEPVHSHVAPDIAHEDILASIDSLLDSHTVKASTEALQSLKSRGAEISSISSPSSGPTLQFRSGATVEDLVIEALKPELKQWLNTHLPAMVERLVAAEIKKITS